MCWDLAKSDADLDDYFQDNLGYIKQVHLHDCREINGKTRSHRVIGTGKVNFLKYFRILEEVEVLDYCIEVRPKEKALESLCILQNIV